MSHQQQAQRGDEVFDVVNERDEVIGQSTRREVHGKGLLHRAVHVLVFNRRGQVFLQKRSMAKDSAPGCWDSSCSGHLDAGEGYLAAAVRELGEEIGLSIAGPHLLTPVLRIAARTETANEFVWVYQLDSEGPFVLHPAEIERGEWFLPSDVAKAIVEKPVEYARSFRYLWTQLSKAQRLGR
jgi:isopentenyldiphosphate isomerase